MLTEEIRKKYADKAWRAASLDRARFPEDALPIHVAPFGERVWLYDESGNRLGAGSQVVHAEISEDDGCPCAKGRPFWIGTNGYPVTDGIAAFCYMTAEERAEDAKRVEEYRVRYGIAKEKTNG